MHQLRPEAVAQAADADDRLARHQIHPIQVKNTAKKASSKSKQQDVKDKAKKAQERKQGNKKNKGMMVDNDEDAPAQLPEKWAD